MKEEIMYWNWESLLGKQTLDDDWNVVERKIQELIEKFIPKKKDSGKSRLKKEIWMDATTLAKVRAKDAAYQKYLKSRDKDDFENYTRIRNQARWKTRQAKKAFEKNIAKESKTNPKAFFNYARSKTKCRTGISDLIMTDGKTTINDTEKADTLNTFFSSVFTPLEDSTPIPDT